MKVGRVGRFTLMALVGIGLLGGGYFAYSVERDREAEKATQLQALESAKRAQEAAAREPRLDQAMQAGLPQGYRRTASPWLANQKSFYQELFAGTKADVLVVPFGVQDWTFDRATRSLMTVQLAAAVAHSGAQKVADPYLVAQALGDGQRRLDGAEMRKLADAIGVTRVIWGFVGHDRKGKMNLLLLSQERAKATGQEPWSTPVVAKRFENIAFEDERPPIDAYQALMPDLTKALDLVLPAVDASESKLDSDGLTESPLTLIKGEDNAARDAYAFLLLGSLTPNYIERTRERFAEKAYLATSRMSPQSPEYRLLRARAYAALGYRLAAIKAQGTPGNDEERHFLAVLNGNLLDARAMARKETHALKRLLQELDVNAIEASYGVITAKDALEKLRALKFPGDIWPYLAARAFTDWDDWSQFDNGNLKVLLDREFPVPGFSLEDMLRGAASVGDPQKVGAMVQLSFLDHVRKFIKGDRQNSCCLFADYRPRQFDILELLQAQGHDNLIRGINFLSQIQGRPEEAIAMANELEPIYQGYPYYTLERAKAKLKLAANVGGAASEGLGKAGNEDAYNAMVWEQGQSHVVAEANYALRRQKRSDYGLLSNLYFTDLPFRPYTSIWTQSTEPEDIQRNGEMALKNSLYTLFPLQEAVAVLNGKAQGDEVVGKLLQPLEGRFIGSPQFGELVAKNELRAGNASAAMDRYRQIIEVAPNSWRAYFGLGKLLFEEGKVKEASKVFLSYPEFGRKSSENRVGIANSAFEAGSLLYWAGQFDLAEPLYKIAAAQNTGAAAEISSSLRIDLLAGRYADAMEKSLQRGRRYNDSYAYRDYLGMLHALGQAKEAWASFGNLARELGRPHLWETALVGHHMAGQSEADVAQWIKQGDFKDSGERRSQLAVYLLRFATTDRTPSPELAASLDAIDYPTWLNGKQVVRHYGSPGREAVVGPPGEEYFAYIRQDEGGQTAQAAAYRREHRVKSDLAYFAEGYRLLKGGDFAHAREVFAEASRFYDLSFDQTRYMLPYYALAAAKAGDTADVEQALGRLKPAEHGFEFQLCQGILAALSGKVDDALQSLTLARYRRPNTEERPLLTQYVYGEISEMLADLTGNDKLRELALDWAKKNERSEPWQAWSYAIEARLTKNPTERRRAIAMAAYLDPKSERLAGFKKKEIDDAASAYKQSNPFLRLRLSHQGARAGRV